MTFRGTRARSGDVRNFPNGDLFSSASSRMTGICLRWMAGRCRHAAAYLSLFIVVITKAH
jgi:hypothetical protein